MRDWISRAVTHFHGRRLPEPAIPVEYAALIDRMNYLCRCRLERTDDSGDEISWQARYEDSAFFRRLFKRVTGLAPGAYRKRFRIPEFARLSYSDWYSRLS